MHAVKIAWLLKMLHRVCSADLLGFFHLKQHWSRGAVRLFLRVQKSAEHLSLKTAQ
jgi:hypothetical protein